MYANASSILEHLDCWSWRRIRMWQNSDRAILFYEKAHSQGRNFGLLSGINWFCFPIHRINKGWMNVGLNWILLKPQCSLVTSRVCLRLAIRGDKLNSSGSFFLWNLLLFGLHSAIKLKLVILSLGRNQYKIQKIRWRWQTIENDSVIKKSLLFSKQDLKKNIFFFQYREERSAVTYYVMISNIGNSGISVSNFFDLKIF